MKTEFTKGKWKFVPAGEAMTYDTMVIAEYNKIDWELICNISSKVGHKQEKANAKLIAAAPNTLHTHETNVKNCKEIQKAIEKQDWVSVAAGVAAILVNSETAIKKATE